MDGTAGRSRTGLLVGLLLALLLLAPLLGPGYVLVRDMVFVPRIPLGRQLLGIGSVPRAVPSDLLLALAGRVLTSGWTQDVVLVAIVVGAAWGAARLAPTTSAWSAAAAATSYGWSAYLHERLLLGQWALLIGWAVLPWAARASLAWRQGASAWWPLGALAVAALGGANSLLLVAVVVVVCGPPWRALAATAVLALPWALPGVMQHPAPGDPAGVAAFAANSDTPFGPLGSLLTGGGVWARTAVPAGRSAGSWIALALALLALVGLPELHRRLGRRLSAAAAVGLALALLGVVPGAQQALRWSVVHVPAAGLLRDGQKWVAPLLLLLSAALACTTERLLARARDPRSAALLGLVLAVAPVAALSGAAWGEGGRLRVSHYPASWQQVTGRAGHGTVLVLPWRAYRAFPWEHRVPVLDPATKMLRWPVVNDRLPLAGSSVRGEDPRAAALDPAVTSGQPLLPSLRAAGISQVLVERTTSGGDEPASARQTAGLRLRARTPELALYDVPGVVARPPRTTVALWPVVAGDCLALGLLAAAWTGCVRARGGR